MILMQLFLCPVSLSWPGILGRINPYFVLTRNRTLSIPDQFKETRLRRSPNDAPMANASEVLDEELRVDGVAMAKMKDV